MGEILLLYRKYNRPGAQKLLLLAKSEGLQVTSKEIKEFQIDQKSSNQKKVKTQNRAKGTL